MTSRHSSYADWAFASVYSTSLVGESCLLAFGWQPDPARSGRLRREFIREFDGSEILRTERVNGLSWGAGDKICGISGGEVTVMRYVQKNVTKPETETPKAFLISDSAMTASSAKAINVARLQHRESPFGSVGSVPLKEEADVIKAGLAYFGILLETSDQLHVYRSDSDVWSAQGPIVRWRTYPRAKFYENHLHIVVQDAVHIVAFMHDYWEDQEEKIAGIRYRYRPDPRRSTF